MEYVVLASAKLNGGSARCQICHNTHSLDTIPDYHKRFYGFTYALCSPILTMDSSTMNQYVSPAQKTFRIPKMLGVVLWQCSVEQFVRVQAELQNQSSLRGGH